MTLTHQQVLDFVRQHGPSVPNDIRQALKAQDNFVVGAMLGELVSAGKLKMTHFSLGTSRFYYDPESPELLERVAHQQNEKDARATELLKSRQVVKNSELEPLMRVAMVNIPDYSRVLRVPTPAGEELFWRYFLVSEPDALQLVRERYFGERPVTAQPAPTPSSQQQDKIIEQPTALRFGKKILPAHPDATAVKPVTPPAPVSGASNPAVSAPAETKPKKSRVKKTAAPDFSSGFAAQVRSFFDAKGIGVVELLKATKTEVSCLISVPSPVGTATYFCKAKAKKSSSDGDLASALLEAQHHKLPLCYIAGGKLSKKAEALLGSQFKGSLVVSPWA